MANTRFRSETGLYVTGSAGSTAEIETILNVSNSVTVSESTTLNALNVDGVTNISNTFYITTDLPTTFNEGVTLLSTSANSDYGVLTVYDVDLQGTPSNTVRIGDLFQNATSTSDTWVVVGETDANTFSVKDLNGTAQPPNGSYKIIRPAEPVILNVSSGGYTANLSVRGTGVFLDGDVHTVTGDLIVQTNLVVQGDQIQIGELLYDGDIVSSTDGLVIGGANSSGEMDASHFPWTVYTQGVWLGNTSNFNTSTHTGTIAISPTVSGEYSLGTGSYYWKNVYANNITVSETLLPLADGDDLGSTGKRWDIFGQTLDIETSVLKATGTGVGIGTSTITANYPLNVNANTQFSKDVFVNSANVTATTLRAVTSVVPTVDNAGAVGNSSLTWASGQFTNFTVDNILTVPNHSIDSAVYLGTTSVPTDRTSGTLTLSGIQLNQTSAIIANTSTGDNEYKLLFSDSTGIVNTYIHFLRDSQDGVYTYNPSDNRLSVTNIASAWIGIGSNVSDARANGQLNSENLRIMGASVSGASVDKDTHLVIDSGTATGNVAIALLSSNTAFPQINFGRVGDTDIAGIIYNQAANTMNFTVKGTINRLKITSLGIETPRIDVGGNIVPDTDGNYAIGNSSLKFSSAYFGDAVTAGTFTDGTFSVTSGAITGATWNGNIIASAYLDGDTAHLSGDQTFTGNKTFSGDVTFNKAGTANTLVNIIAEDTKVAGLFIGGSGDGTGYIEVGQGTSYGGGIVYEGDDNPGSFANSGVTGSLADKLVYYRKNNGTRTAVFYNDFNSSNVTFVGSITASNLSGTHSGTNTGDVSLAGGYDYITISNQVITRNQIDLATDVTGTLPVGNGGTGNTTFTQYGILYGDAANAIKVTGAGSSGQILKSNGTAPPDWINQSLIDAGKVDGKDFGTFSGAGGVLYATSTASANGIAAGTTGQVLVSGGSGAPTWTNQSGLGVDFASLTNKLSGTNDYSTDGDLISGRGSGGAALTINDGYGNANITWNHQNGTPEQNGNAGRISVNTDGVHVAYDWSNPTTHSANLAYMSFELKSAVPNGVAGNTPEAMVLKEDQLNLGSYNTKLIANDYEPTANNTGSIGTTYLRYDTAFVDDLTVTNTVTAATGTFTTLTTSDLTASTTTKVTNLNADLLDSISSGSFLRSDADDVFGATGGTYIRFDDDKELRFGTGSDFKIYHNGTDSVISHQSNVAGNDLLIRSIQDVFIQSGNGSTGYENAIQAINNGAVTLFHSGSTRLTTTGDGVDVTGDFSASGKLLSETGGTNGTNTKKLSLYLSGVNDTGTAAHAMKSYYAPQGSTLSSSVGRYGYVSVVEQNSTFNNTSHTNLNMHGIWSQVQGGFGAYEPNLARAGHFETINRAGTLDNSGHTTSPYDGIFEGIYAKATIDSSSPYYLNAVRGAWIEAEYSGDNVSENVQAIRTKAYTNNPIGGVTDLQNIYAQSQIDSSSSVLGTFRGANFQMVNNGSVSGDSSGVLVSYSGSGSYSANMFGLYANMGSVTPTGTKYGLYIDNETTNYLSGNLQVDGIMYAQHAPTTTNTGHTQGQLIYTNATVSGTFGANYRNAGLFIDVDSSGTPTANATTGRFNSIGSYITNHTTAQNSYYSYGINVLNYHSGALTAGAADKAQHYGAYIQGQSDVPSGYINVNHGLDVRSYAGSSGFATTATYDNIYGIFTYAYKYDSVTTGTTGVATGLYSQIGMDTNAGYITTGAPLYSYIGTTSTALRNSYGFYNNMGQRRTGTYTGYNTMGVYVNWGGNVSGSTKYSWYSNGGANALSYFAGQIQATGDITAYYSDERLKNNLGNITNALDKVKSLNGFYYKPNALGQSFGYKDEMHVGVSAQQVEKILPEVVQLAPFDRAKEYVDGKPVSESGENYKTVQYDKLVPLLIEAIKEQDEKINRLESMVEQLLNKKEML